MRSHQLLLPLGLLLIALGVPSFAQTLGEAQEASGGAGPLVTYYDVGKSFSLNCSLAAPVQWRRNGTLLAELGAGAARFKLEEGGSVLKTAGRSQEDDYGNYSCSGAGGAELAWELRGRPHVKLAPNTNVVEGQKLKISCKVVGKPYPRVWWLFSNESEPTNGTDALLALGERARLETNDQGIEGGALVLEPAQRSDAGVFWCGAGEPVDRVNGTTTLRVKDMYAALWPFLGICAEVLLLCAVILVYEKRRTKPELDDSDTDNHDQKKS